jgi:hypothetical protein
VPVLFIPSDNSEIDGGKVAAYKDLVRKYLVLAQSYYRTQLVTDTFEIAEGDPLVYTTKHPLSYYIAHFKVAPDTTELVVREMFDWLGEDRYSSRSVYLQILCPSVSSRATRTASLSDRRQLFRPRRHIQRTAQYRRRRDPAGAAIPDRRLPFPLNAHPRTGTRLWPGPCRLSRLRHGHQRFDDGLQHSSLVQWFQPERTAAGL